MPGKKSQPLAGFDRRPRQHDARHALVQQRRNGHGHGEIRFPGARRSHAEHQIVALDGVHVAALIDGLGRERLLSEIALASAVHQAAQGDFGIGRHHAQIAVQIAVGEALAFFHQSDIIFQNAGGANHVRLGAFDLERIVHQAGGDVQPAFEHTDIFVAGAEQGLNAAGDLNAQFHSASSFQEEMT